jgi:ABC-type multidrug transport system ATPase subunit
LLLLGKSVLLRALAGRLSHDSGLSGELRYNGLTGAECRARGIHVTRLASYVGQNDLQFPVLTVEETLDFAKDNGVADVELLNPDESLRKMDGRRTELLMDLLGLTECKSTAIGSDLMRGVSGGQKKRAQLGETLMSNARIYALDEVSNGLDSAVTLHIFSALRQACGVNQSSVVTALQQVTPETYALFDDIILMRDGHVLYHGAREGITTWLREVMHVSAIPASLEEAGFLVDILSDPKQAFEKAALAHKVAIAQAEGRKPSPPPIQQPDSPDSAFAPISPFQVDSPSPVTDASAVPAPAAEGIVRFHIEVEQVQPQQHQPPRKQSDHSSSNSGPSPYKLSPEKLSSISDLSQLLSVNEKHVSTSIRRAHVSDALSNKESISSRTMVPANWSSYTRSQYGQEFPHSTLKHTALSCSRQSKLLSRNLTMVVPRIFNSILMGLVYGTLFYQLKQADFASRLGIIQNAVMFMAFANFQELPVAAEAKMVVVRQINAGFYPAISYTTAVNLLTLPLAILEAIVFGILVYFIPGFELDAGRFFFFLFLLLSVSSAMSQTFRTITYIAGNADVAQQMNMPFVMLFVVYGGFLIPRVSIQNWLIWAYYLSPFSWATDSLGINEFSAAVYDPLVTLNGETIRLGDSYLAAFGLRSEKVWQWAAIAYLWGFYIVLSWISSILLKFSTPVNPMGTKRPASARLTLTAGNHAKNAHGIDDADAAVPLPAVVIDVVSAPPATNGHHANGSEANGNGNGSLPLPSVHQKRLGGGAKSSAKESFQLSSMPFTPATLSWKDLKYTVYVGKEKTPKVLLNKISGYAEPGKLTALMGSSGAGQIKLIVTPRKHICSRFI